MVKRKIDEISELAIREHLKNAIDRLKREDGYLFEKDANERSLAFRLAHYLISEFSDFDVDFEYNRHHNEHDLKKRLYSKDVKALAPPRKEPLEDDEGLTVFPDIIVHRRDSDDNLLVIEIKKTTSTVSRKFDLAKLEAFKAELKYRYAISLQLETSGTGAEAKVEFVSGVCTRILSQANARNADSGAK